MSKFKRLTKQEAEKKSGKKLDGRRKYFIWDNVVCYNSKYLRDCSGCSENYTLTYDPKRKMNIGMGCPECGYTGVRIEHLPCPV